MLVTYWVSSMVAFLEKVHLVLSASSSGMSSFFSYPRKYRVNFMEGKSSLFSNLTIHMSISQFSNAH